MQHFVKLLPQSVQATLDFGQIISSNRLHKVVPKFFQPQEFQDEYQFKSHLVENEIFTFSFVRHPFDRLVSAYYDKIVSQDDPSYRGRGKAILANYGAVTFSNFIKYVLSENESYMKCESRCSLDVHWRPFYLRCAYCLINYSFIGRMETFAKDVRYY